MLANGQSYQQTIGRTGASSATISRVKRCLEYGAGGYSMVLERMGETEAGQEEQEPT
jgi:TrpR-related protein YerC/YecD